MVYVLTREVHGVSPLSNGTGDVIALSVSLVAYVRRTSELIATLRTHEVTASIPILVGGQPFNLVEDLWQVVGADGCAATSTGSPGKAAQLLGA